MNDLFIELMKEEHLQEVIKIEKLSYSSPWSYHIFLNEITRNSQAYYVVGKIEDKIICYAGMWFLQDEAHISNLATHPEYRRKGFGEKLLIHLIEVAIAKKIRWITLEVRVSNIPAQELYKKYTFKNVGTRTGYYLDNKEDALIMWSEDLQTKEFQDYFEEIKTKIKSSF